LFVSIIISLCIVDGKKKETTDPLQTLETMMQTESECDVYMGPSMIKEAEQQGFGLGLYTGIMLYEGQDINWDETIIPFYDSKTIDLHPPLREYLWPGNMIPEMAFVSSADRNSLWFSPGLSSIAPCTSGTGFNLRLSGPGAYAGKLQASSRSNVVEDESTPPRTSPQAGSYSYHHKLSYEAARNILPGEELVLECIGNEEHEFNAPVHLSIAKFNSSASSFVCLDNVESDTSTAVGGQGLFVDEESISKGDRILSSPVVPIHRKELFGDGTGNTASSGYNPYQLLLNYCIGHPESDVLLLPYGPMFSYINHPPNGIKTNAIIKWHKTDAQQVSRRQQYHHPEELFEMSPEEVTSIHGKGLMIDVIALDNIAVGEEIYIDYSDVWRKAWDDHVKRWKPPEGASQYISADKWFNSQDENTKHSNKDYPDNLISVCYYDNDAHLIRVDEKMNTIHTEWQDDDLESKNNQVTLFELDLPFLLT